jgi:hypothetical protein
MMKRGGKADGFSILPPGDGDVAGPFPVFPRAMPRVAPNLRSTFKYSGDDKLEIQNFRI